MGACRRASRRSSRSARRAARFRDCHAAFRVVSRVSFPGRYRAAAGIFALVRLMRKVGAPPTPCAQDVEVVDEVARRPRRMGPANKTWLQVNDASERRRFEAARQGRPLGDQQRPRIGPTPRPRRRGRSRRRRALDGGAAWTSGTAALEDGKCGAPARGPRPAHGMRGDDSRAYAVKAFSRADLVGGV